MQTQVDGLLAAVGDEQLLGLYIQALAAKQADELPLERLVAVRRAELENAPPFAAQHRVRGVAEFFERKRLVGRPRDGKRDGAGRNARHHAAETFFGAIVGEKRFPAHRTVVSVPMTIGARRRRKLFLGNRADVRAAADVALDQALGFEFSVGVCDRRPVNAELAGQFAACGNAVARAKLARMDERAQLIAQLYVQRNVAFGL